MVSDMHISSYQTFMKRINVMLPALWFVLAGILVPVTARQPLVGRWPWLGNDALQLPTERRNNNSQGIEAIHRPQAMRALKQQTFGAKVTVVTTPQELMNALEEEAEHIEIRAHLDLTTVEPRFSYNMLFLRSRDVERTIRGNCTKSITSADLALSGVASLEGLKPKQCVLMTDMVLGTLAYNTWLHNLYIRHHNTGRGGGSGSVLWCDKEACNLWMTDVTIQGDGSQDPTFGGLKVAGGKLYGEGVSIIDFSSRTTAVFINDGATVTLQNCTVARTSQSSLLGSPIYISESRSPPSTAPDQDAVLRLEDCTFNDNNAAQDISAISFVRHEAALYSDVKRSVLIFSGSRSDAATLPLEDAPANRPGIDASSAWFVNVQQLLSDGALNPSVAETPQAPSAIPPQPPADEPPESTTTPASPESSPSDSPAPTERTFDTDASDDSGGGDNTAAIVGGSVAAGVVCIAIILGLLIYSRRRSRARAVKNEEAAVTGVESNLGQPNPAPDAQKEVVSDSGSKSAHEHLNYDFNGSQPVPGLSVTSASQPSTHTSLTASTTNVSGRNADQRFVSTVAPRSQTRCQTDTFDLTHTAVEVSLLSPPGPQASADEKIDFLQQQLDSIGPNTPIYEDLVLLGSGHNDRRQGGQAIVQMAVSRNTRLEYAIKFFLSASAFKEECGLYKQGSGIKGGNFAQFLPKVLHVIPNEDGQVKDAHGHPLPPCIVMERGESLDLWADRRHPDRSQAFSMMHQLANRLMELHALGYVHRDLKPGNVMWLPRENRWTVIDFGCVAKTGTAARLGFSLVYAAPEVIAAFRSGNPTMVAEEAVDVWSLGVMAFELLTGGPAISMLDGKEKAMDRIQGLNGLQLPWEGTLTPSVRRQLGVFRGTVLKLLARDPADRPSMKEFCVSCDRVLGGSTSVHV